MRLNLGVLIYDDNINWTEMILNGTKTIETRNSSVYKNKVGSYIGLISKRNNISQVLGYAKLEDHIAYASEEEFNQDYNKHKVSVDSEYHFSKNHNKTTGKKYGLVLTDIHKFETPVLVNKKDLQTCGIKVFKNTEIYI